MLTEKHKRFVAEYLIDLNATQAAMRAGYSKKTAGSQAHDLLKKPEIATYLNTCLAKAIDRAELSADRVLEEMRRLSFSNVRDLFDADGNLIPIHKLTREQASCIASVEVVKKNLAAGDGQTDVVHKIKVWDKTRSLEQLGKHFGVLKELVDVTVHEDVTQVLKRRYAKSR